MRRLIGLFLSFLILMSIPSAYGGTHVVNEKRKSIFEYSDTVVLTGPEAFIIKGSRGMHVGILIGYAGNPSNDSLFRAYLIPGEYVPQSSFEEPEDYDMWHSQTEEDFYFSTNFIMVHEEEYTLLIVPNESAAYNIDIYGDDETSSLDMTTEVCFAVGLITVAVFIAYVKWNGATRRSRSPPLEKKYRENKGRPPHTDEDDEAPYEIR